MSDLQKLMIDQFYKTLDTNFKLLGPEHTLKALAPVTIPRFLNCYVDYLELQRIFARVKGFNSWYRAWCVSAAEFETMAAEAEGKGNYVSAGEAYLKASMLHLMAYVLIRNDDTDKITSHLKGVELYRKGCRYFDPPAEMIEIPYNDLAMPGYIRIPRAGLGQYAKKPPCAILIKGATGILEDVHRWSAVFVERGIATLYFSGPGQGVLAPRFTGLRVPIDSFEETVSAAIDYIEKRGDVDAERIGIFGSSTGGYLISRAAAFDRRIKAAVSAGGFYDARDFAHWPLMVKEEFRGIFGLESYAEVQEHVAAKLSLSGIAAKIECPYLVVHGALDDLTSVAEATQMSSEAKGPSDLWVFEDGYHNCGNLNHVIAPRIGDWMKEKLE